MFSRARTTPSGSRIATCDEGPASHGLGRVCAAEGCTTVLSRYNPSGVCCQHSHGWVADEVDGVGRQPRPELIGNCLNPRCQAEFVTANAAKKFCSNRCRMQAFQLRRAAEMHGAVAGRTGQAERNRTIAA